MSVTRRRKQKTEHGLFFMRLDSMWPSPENDTLYRPVLQTDPAIIRLAADIKKNGLLDPIVVSRDGFIVSGHRRYAAATLAGLVEVPVTRHPVAHDDPEFVPLLTSYNQQREKTFAEKLRETVVEASQSEAVAAMQSFRIEQSRNAVAQCSTIAMGYRRPRSKISANKWPMLRVILEILNNELKGFLPTTVRTIHYQLLNKRVLITASKPNSWYCNDEKSYKALIGLLVQARLEEYIPHSWIIDPTRPTTNWSVHSDPKEFLAKQMEDFLKGYWRDLLQSQPNHIEVIGEKNTIDSIISPVCMKFTVPYAIGRGYCSLEPRAALHKRYVESGKEKLVLVILSDFDPDGDMIAQSFAHSLRDDFGVDEEMIVAVRAALTPEQVKTLKLPRSYIAAKKTSKHYERFVSKHGSDAVYELEAVPPVQLQGLLEDTLEQVIDLDRFNDEAEAEQDDQTEIENIRRRTVGAMRLAEGGEC